MAVISEQHNLLYILNPRTASTALGTLLCTDYGGAYFPEEDIMNDNGTIRVPRKHTKVTELAEHGLLSEAQLTGLRKFVTVRNPFDSLASIWVKKRYQYAELAKSDPNFFGRKLPGFMNDMDFIAEHTFSEWIIKTYSPLVDDPRSQSVNRPHYRGCDAFLRFESLQADFDRLMTEWNCPTTTIPVINTTEKKMSDYRLYYNEDAIAVIRQVFRWDLQMFDYDF